MMEEADKLELLKHLLLTDERDYADSIAQKIEILEDTISTRSKLEEKLHPIIEDELKEFARNIPQELGPVITKTLKKQIAESRDEVVEALYPILGQMIKKYIAQEIKILSEKIDQKTKENLSFDSWKRRIISKFTGVKEHEIILSETASAKIDQVFVIDSDSGILLGSFFEKSTMDEDMVSGMLTAIKSFVEDAFLEHNQKLTSIEYDLYQIHLFNTPNYYIATAVSGTITERLESEIDDLALKVSAMINELKSKDNKEDLDSILIKIYSQNSVQISS
ncbi:cell envelope biogenesis protein OmpA [Nonlabens ponticola]|uniref:Cell envelope biogenesis protein OmpA n=1 Tax=Nonlabens ponticola TaxID=2496866 RepID=A0A3S9MWJ2_9FLAO|nr:cell envelope biogenesis protein OmpA [Nonlabens ponticola]AZQ43483.1 cell envelope biogenesis protein OmpA [Nonlabens ponticola]